MTGVLLVVVVQPQVPVAVVEEETADDVAADLGGDVVGLSVRSVSGSAK
ncbi:MULTISPECIES: hypothetical protein [Nocardiopsidaceae]|uniref:Secreted protein n=1 Tax=Streptomonospora nanhaiensis TaxID=1323731 RepID=A0ABY6YXX0_9ACTN|nr:hypothetical protein [Streptomonospora nanhaiensis]WAE76836.1 hypothetical protein OUQ99_31500 [Streptomonospora nanhaiensis]